MSALAERVINEHLMVTCKPNTQKYYKLLLKDRILPFLGCMKISSVTSANIHALQYSMQHIPESANHCIKILSKIFNLAHAWGLYTNTNPCRHIKKFKSKRIERYLNQEETKRLGEVLNEVKQYPDENLSAVYCIQLLILTGCRLGEIQTLKWQYIDYENGVLKLPDSKTGAKTVYVGSAVMSLLQEIKEHPRRPTDNTYVIWGKKQGAYLNNVQKPWRRFRKLAGLNDVRIHDLRHNFASFAVNRGMSLPIIGKLLGHTQTQTTARYAHLMAHSMKEAANTITNDLSPLLKVSNEITKTNNNTNIPTKIKTISGTSIKAPVYLTSNQAAEYLNVNPGSMEYWRSRKVGPSFIRVGNRVRYKLEALDEFLNNKNHF